MCLLVFQVTVSSFSQDMKGYTIPIQYDTAIRWAAESDQVINVSPKISEYSLKKWYLNKLRSSTVIAYKKEKGNSSVSSYSLSLPELQTQEWLKGLSIELSPTKHPQEWYFVDRTIPAADYNRYKARAGKLNLQADSCCGCDDADAFRARQVLTYKNGKFNIYNVFISPLCVRQTATTPSDWYPLCNVAYNGNIERKFPGLSKDVVLLNTNELDYDFNTLQPSAYESVLTVYRTDIGSLIYQDMLSGRQKAIDIETGKIMPVKKILTIGMPADTVAVFDSEVPNKLIGYKVLQQERDSRDFCRYRIIQDLYFDFINERLYSVVKEVILMQMARLPNGMISGQYPFCRLE